MVPANRWGSAVYSAPQLKGMQEVITLLVFAGFSAWYLGEPLKWNHWAGFALIAVAAWLIFLELTSRGHPGVRLATYRLDQNGSCRSGCP